MAQPGQQAQAKKVVYTDDEIAALAAYVASLGARPGDPRLVDYSTEGMTEAEREAAIARGGQIFLTNCTACHNFQGSGGAHAPRWLRPEHPQHRAPPHLRGDAHRTQSMDNFSDGNLPPDAKRDVIAYIESLNESPEYGGYGLGGLGPVPEGIAAWVVGIGVLVGVAVWIAAHTTRTSTRKGEPDDNDESKDEAEAEVQA